MAQRVLIHNPALTVDRFVEELNPDSVLVVTDSNVETKVLSRLGESEVVLKSPRVVVRPGEENKNLVSVEKIWTGLEKIGATRNSLIINIGGGMVTDLGGFAAATFKRGIRTLNLPTTLLSAVDAATGGKTGINYNGLKNEIGAFHSPSGVILSTLPFSTLSRKDLLSGYAEMVKSALIADRNLYISLLEIHEVLDNTDKLGKSVIKCVEIKEEIVAVDPLEKGLRKILNFGHTSGHAFESFRLRENRAVTHGEAVAHGILVALVLSHLKLGFETIELNHYRNFLKNNYGGSLINCADIPSIISLISHDKKNLRAGMAAFTLLRNIGSPEINVEVTPNEIQEALEIYQDMMG